MKTNITKLTSLVLAALLAIPAFTGCQKEKTGATLEMPLNNSYRSEEIMQARKWSMYDAVIGSCVYFGKGTQQNRVTVILEYHTETGVSREITPACAEQRQKAANHIGVTDVLELENGKKGLLCEEYYPRAFDAPEIYRRCIEVYDADWNLLETQELPETFAEDVNLFNCGTARDADGNWFVCVNDPHTSEKQIHTYNSQFVQYGSIPLSPNGMMLSQDFIQGTDGEVYMVWVDWEKGVTTMYRLSAEDRTMEDVDVDINFSAAQQVSTGANDYAFFYTDANYLYGVKEEGKERVIDFINSDFKKGSVYDCIALPDGKFVLMMYENNTPCYWLAEKRPQEETENVQFITLAAVGMYDKLVDAVLDYNRTSTSHRILIMDYAESDNPEHIEAGLEQMKADMLEGIVADIICTDGLNFESFSSKGLFDDWYELMDADEEFHREEYLENFFRAYEHNGKLQRLGVDFTVYTQLAKTEFVGEKQGYTMAEFTELVDDLPKGMKPYQYYMYMFDSQCGYVDKQLQKCYFDTPEYIRLMQILNGTSEQRETVTNHEYDFRENRALFYPCTIFQPINYHAIRKTAFLDADLTFTGEPMYALKGNGGQFHTTFTLSVNAQSRQQEAVWDFMKHLLSDDYQKKLDFSMPVQKAALESYLENATHMTAAKTYFAAGEVNVGAATEEEMNELRAYIEGIEAAYANDGTIKNIILEESEMFITGDCTAEEAAKKIQSRVGIYISEQS